MKNRTEIIVEFEESPKIEIFAINRAPVSKAEFKRPSLLRTWRGCN